MVVVNMKENSSSLTFNKSNKQAYFRDILIRNTYTSTVHR
jgi:hypothetical protein